METQVSREVKIINLKELIKELLLEFHVTNNKYKPEKIIYYRDGVDEGFLEPVLLHEYKAIREACAEMGDPTAEYCPPITFIVVQKRHHTRLFPERPPNNRSGNVMPGTVVDTKITNPKNFDFFLCSQAGIQGTVRPAHYRVLVDENNFGANSIELMTYWLCYLSCRCTK